jgi:hypothetical protein
VQVGLFVLGGQVEELDQVGVLENRQGLGMGLPYHLGSLGRVKHRAFEQRALELAFQLAAAPALANREPEVEFPLFGALALAEDDEVVRPGQLSQQCRDNLAARVFSPRLAGRARRRP